MESQQAEEVQRIGINGIPAQNAQIHRLCLRQPARLMHLNRAPNLQTGITHERPRIWNTDSMATLIAFPVSPSTL